MSRPDTHGSTRSRGRADAHDPVLTAKVTVPDLPGTEIIIETTGNQFGDEFHDVIADTYVEPGRRVQVIEIVIEAVERALRAIGQEPVAAEAAL